MAKYAVDVVYSIKGTVERRHSPERVDADSEFEAMEKGKAKLKGSRRDAENVEAARATKISG
jgi:hypothetical protein